MSESYIQNLFAERIGGSAIRQVDRPSTSSRRSSAPSAPPWPRIPARRSSTWASASRTRWRSRRSWRSSAPEARKPENRGYADNGDAVLKQAAARYLDRVCGVKGINPETEVLHSIGSKAALSILPAALINPGDYVLMTVPGLPGLRHARQVSRRPGPQPAADGGEPVSARPGFRPAGGAEAGQGAGAQLSEQPDRRERDAGVLRARSSRSRRSNNLVVIHDAAYAALVFEGQPLSFLATPGAKEVGVELHSASKSFNMTGWRCGFVAGNELLVRAYGDVKDNTDSGQFLADPARRGVRLRPPGDHGEDRGEVFAPHGRAGGGRWPGRVSARASRRAPSSSTSRRRRPP